MASSFPLSQKYIDFINNTSASAEFLEGTTASGKTTVGAGIKFMRMVSRSKKKFHIIASKTVGVAEKNIISKDNGILEIHSNAEYFGLGDKNNKIPHIKFEDKIIYVVGYDNADKWKQILGGQYGCVYVDEMNTANIEFLNEISTRNDYFLGTLNPDDPNLPVYKLFINRSRPFKKYEKDVPPEILSELTEEAVDGWDYWFFNFRDNLSLTDEMIQKKIDSAPKGTKMYKNKILGLRGKATGLVFPNFGKENIVSKEEIRKSIEEGRRKVKYVSCGVDTAYSSKSPDTISMIYQIITTANECIVVDEAVFNNASLDTPLSPSDTVTNLLAFRDKNEEEWGFCRDVFIDSADQATITELNKYKRQHPTPHNFISAYKKTKIVDRIKFMQSWLHKKLYLVCNHCKNHIQEMNTYSWDEKLINTPEDRNNHTIDASCYGWLPYKHEIGSMEEI